MAPPTQTRESGNTMSAKQLSQISNRRRLLQFLAASALFTHFGASAFAQSTSALSRRPDPMSWAPRDLDNLISDPKEAINVFDFEPVAILDAAGTCLILVKPDVPINLAPEDHGGVHHAFAMRTTTTRPGPGRFLPEGERKERFTALLGRHSRRDRILSREISRGHLRIRTEHTARTGPTIV